MRDGATLVFIDSEEEDDYLREMFFINHGETEFWIGLNDMSTEGEFRSCIHNF